MVSGVGAHTTGSFLPAHFHPIPSGMCRLTSFADTSILLSRQIGGYRWSVSDTSGRFGQKAKVRKKWQGSVPVVTIIVIHAVLARCGLTVGDSVQWEALLLARAWG